MFASLRSRLLLVVVAVGVIAIGTTAVIAQQVATNDLRDTLERRLNSRDEVMAELAMYYDSNGSWNNVELMVDALAERTGERIALVDSNGDTTADSDPGADLPSRAVGVVGQPGSTPTYVDLDTMRRCEVFLDFPVDSVNSFEPTPEFSRCLADEIGESLDFRSVYIGAGGGDEASIIGPNGPNARLLAGALIVLLGAIAVMGIALRSALAPIEALRRGARRLQEGELDTRVPEEGATELVELAHSFNAMAHALEQDKERQQRWTSDTAHELRNPIQNLRGQLEAAKDGLMVPDDQWLDSILEEVDQLGHLVADLGVLTLSDSKRIELNRQRVNLGELADDVVTAHRPRAIRAGVSLASTGAAVAEVDQRRLRQAIGNLVDNAIRHTPAGGSVTVDVAAVADGAEVRVRDNGEGIPADAQSRIFDRFARVDEHRSRDVGGSGLGLSIVSVLVEAHGGRVSVDSVVGTGSTFRLLLPVSADAALDRHQ